MIKALIIGIEENGPGSEPVVHAAHGRSPTA